MDEYIAQGTDPRTRIEIERAAKLDTELGPMFRWCDEPSCRKVDDKTTFKMQTCSACKMVSHRLSKLLSILTFLKAFYCSKVCAVKSWKMHKKVCNTPYQYEQRLPSQIALQKFMIENLSRYLEV